MAKSRRVTFDRLSRRFHSCIVHYGRVRLTVRSCAANTEYKSGIQAWQHVRGSWYHFHAATLWCCCRDVCPSSFRARFMRENGADALGSPRRGGGEACSKAATLFGYRRRYPPTLLETYNILIFLYNIRGNNRTSKRQKHRQFLNGHMT